MSTILLQVPPDEETNLTLPPRYGELSTTIMRSNKSSYSFKKDLYEFHKLLTACFLSREFEQCPIDTSVFWMMDYQNPTKWKRLRFVTFMISCLMA